VSFKLVQGDTVVTVAARGAEIRKLVREISKNEDPTSRDHLIYAYHFACAGLDKAAVDYLSKIPANYFYSDIFKDLYRSTLGEIRAQQSPKDERVNRQFEFFVIVKRGIVVFRELNFTAKDAFETFVEEFKTYSKFTD
jgi:hypothetical protein